MRAIFLLAAVVTLISGGVTAEAKKSVRGPDASGAGVCRGLARSLGAHFVALAYESNFWIEMKHKSTVNGQSEYQIIANDANKNPVDCYEVTVAKIGSECTFQAASKISCSGD